MIKSILKYLFSFMFLILLQVVVLNHINLFSRYAPQFYLLFILILPFETPRWLLLVSAFALGLSIDVFTDSLGLHTITTVLAAYTRHFILSFLAPRDGYDSGTAPRAIYFGFPWFIKYAVAVTFLHHFTLYLFETFDLTEIGSVIFNTVAATLFTVITLVISQLFIYRR
jgi:rod shape-determining protein MreD